MIRTEIYANRSVEEDIVQAIEKRLPNFSFSLIEDVKGRGGSGVRHGSAVWPELNNLYIFYGNEADARLINEAVDEVKKASHDEGIKVFQYPVNSLAEK